MKKSENIFPVAPKAPERKPMATVAGKPAIVGSDVPVRLQKRRLGPVRDRSACPLLGSSTGPAGAEASRREH